MLSESAARIDRREKLLAYRGLTSLGTYLLVEQSGNVRIDYLNMNLPLAEVYADVSNLP